MQAAYGPDAHGQTAYGAGAYGGPPPVEATRPLPRIEDDLPPPGGPTPPAPRSSGPSRPPKAVLVGAAIAVCAAAGLAIGAVLGGGDGDGGTPQAAPATASATAPSAPPAPNAAPSPTPSPTPSPARPPVPAGTFVLVDPATGRAADVSGGATHDGAAVIAWERHAQPNQQWQVADLGDGHTQLRAVHSGLCLQPADPPGPGAAVVQRPCADSDAQRWASTPSADGTVHTFTLKGRGLVLAPAGPENGAPLSLRAPDAAGPQGWALQAP
ncbi:RICIN domain-containing protein [Streptomyces fradiae]|uniref:RICIN domain-containing protein n=1 Tax=Streptomyces fradiae TaxID=1906 RepID=UPI003985CE80